MEQTLIYGDNKVSKKNLKNLGIVNEQLMYMNNKGILKKAGEFIYQIIKIDEFKTLVLKKLIETNSGFLTEKDLNYLSITPIERRRLRAYGIATQQNGNFVVNGKIENIFLCRPEIDMILYKYLYKESMKKNNLIESRDYLKKYAEICDALNIESDYYYQLSLLNNEIEKQTLTEEQLYNYNILRKRYRKAKSNKRYKDALEIAYECYKINRGSIEATMIAEARINAGNSSNSKILRFLEEAIVKDPTNPTPYKYLGSMYIKMGMSKEAVSINEKYISLDKNSSYDGYIQLFNAYLINNDIKSAHHLLSQVLFIIPNSLIDKFIQNCITVTKKCIAKEYSLSRVQNLRLRELNNLRDTLLKESCFTINDSIENDDENNKYISLENDLEELLIPNEENVVNLKNIESYISNLNVSNEQKNIAMLRASLVLAKNNYVDKSNSLILKVERSKDKDEEVLEQLFEVRNKIKLLNKGI